MNDLGSMLNFFAFLLPVIVAFLDLFKNTRRYIIRRKLSLNKLYGQTRSLSPLRMTVITYFLSVFFMFIFVLNTKIIRPEFADEYAIIALAIFSLVTLVISFSSFSIKLRNYFLPKRRILIIILPSMTAIIFGLLLYSSTYNLNEIVNKLELSSNNEVELEVMSVEKSEAQDKSQKAPNIKAFIIIQFVIFFTASYYNYMIITLINENCTEYDLNITLVQSQQSGVL